MQRSEKPVLTVLVDPKKRRGAPPATKAPGGTGFSLITKMATALTT
jgi:hypothetical protein